MIKSVLLAVDGSNYTEAILKHGIDFAKTVDAHLRVLTVIDIRIFEWAVAIGVEGFAPIIPSTTYQEESQKLLEDKAEKVLDRASKVLKKADVSFEVEKVSGSPVEIICDRSRLADLLVMGSRGEFGSWRDKMLGATLEAATRLCIKPIMVTERDYKKTTGILVAYDGSDNSNKALPWAGYFAQQLDVPLTVLTVDSDQENADKNLKEANDYLASYKLKKLDTMVKDGEAEKEIVETSKDIKADLVVMGSYGHSRIREAILGSTTVQVMRMSTVPVLMAK